MLTVENIITSTEFYMGRKVKFNLTVPELRKYVKYGTITQVFPWVVCVIADDGKTYTLDKKSFFCREKEDDAKAFFV